MNIRKLSLFLSSAVIALSSFGWGQKGHDTTAYIAECHLTPAAKLAVDSILGGKSMVYYANWADNACHTEPYAYTKAWHYKNIDANQTFEKAPTIKEGNIVTALNDLIKVLEDENSPVEEKKLALMLTVHFLGDIHQPMHLGRLSDRGGNRHNVKFFDSDTNLHSAWDSRLVESAHKWSYTEWQENIDRAGVEETEEILTGGNPLSWAKETYGIACKIYEETPQGTKIAFDYISDWTPVIETQFLRGGLRLADLLNGIFDSDYIAKNGIKQP